MAEPAAAASAEGEVLDRAADRLRDSAKWLVAAFGAVAAIIFAGLTVADLGALDGDTPGYRLAIALVGATAAIGGIVAALGVAMRLAGASTTSLDDLTRSPRWWDSALRDTQAELRHDPSLAVWSGELTKFRADYKQAFREYVAQARAYADDPGGAPDPAELKKAFFRLDVMAALTQRLLGTMGFLRLQRSFVRARVVIAVFMVVAAAGAVAFGWATSSVPAEPPTLPSRPVAGTLQPDEDTLDELNRQVDGECAFAIGDDIPVIALAEDTDSRTLMVVTLPAAGCAPATAMVPVAHVTGT